jgi:hypothetical protein
LKYDMSNLVPWPQKPPPKAPMAAFLVEAQCAESTFNVQLDVCPKMSKDVPSAKIKS